MKSWWWLWWLTFWWRAGDGPCRVVEGHVSGGYSVIVVTEGQRILVDLKEEAGVIEESRLLSWGSCDCSHTKLLAPTGAASDSANFLNCEATMIHESRGPDGEAI
jgi:hypothetical protein